MIEREDKTTEPLLFLTSPEIENFFTAHETYAQR